jgi:hypothetical protein
LLCGESRREYDEICKSLILSIGPQNHLEWLLLKQVLDLYWEILRLSKAKAALINMSWNEALRQSFESILPGDEDERRLAAQAHVDGWYTDLQNQESGRKLLLKHGIDTDDITAQAMTLRLPEIEIVDRLLEKKRVVQMATLREIEHYRLAGTWNGGKSLQQTVDEGLSSIIPAPPVPKIVNAR